MWRTDPSAVGPVDLPEPARSQNPMLRLFRCSPGLFAYDAKSHFACIFARDDLDPLVRFLEGQSLDEVKAARLHAADVADDRLAALWSQLTRLRGLGAFTPGPLTQLAEVDAEAIARRTRYYDDNIVTRKFCLEVTQACNFRCRYCPYTVETTGRVHASVHMSMETAVKAIDYYFDRYMRLWSRIPPDQREGVLGRAAPFLSWFGGEPLLRFPLVRESLAYFERKPWDPEQRRSIRYSLTTNFSVFSDEIARFLTTHRVLLHVSLDGPEVENDKNRVFKSGSGTFRTVFGNLQKLKAFAPDYFETCVMIQSVGADNLDLPACANFFKEAGGPRSERVGLGRYRPSPVAKRGTVVREAERERSQLAESFDAGVAAFAAQLALVRGPDDLAAARSSNSWFSAQLTQLRDFVGIAESPRGCRQARRAMLTCPMGFDQLYVSADGGLHMCQLTDGSVGLGDVSHGLDHSIITRRYLDYQSSWNNASCRSCWAVNLCRLCAAVLSQDGGFFRPSPAECQHLRLSAEQAMCNYLVLCKRPELLEALRAEMATAYQGQVDIGQL
jgi:uncharacterized protein